MILNIKALFEFLAKQKRYTLVNLIVGLESEETLDLLC